MPFKIALPFSLQRWLRAGGRFPPHWHTGAWPAHTTQTKWAWVKQWKWAWLTSWRTGKSPWRKARGQGSFDRASLFSHPCVSCPWVVARRNLLQVGLTKQKILACNTG